MSLHQRCNSSLRLTFTSRDLYNSWAFERSLSSLPEWPTSHIHTDMIEETEQLHILAVTVSVVVKVQAAHQRVAGSNPAGSDVRWALTEDYLCDKWTESHFESKHLLNDLLLIYLAVILTLAEWHMQVKTVTDACVLTTFTRLYFLLECQKSRILSVQSLKYTYLK